MEFKTKNVFFFSFSYRYDKSESDMCNRPVHVENFFLIFQHVPDLSEREFYAESENIFFKILWFDLGVAQRL